MDTIHLNLPECPITTRLSSPATSMTLNSEMAGALWMYFWFRAVVHMFPGGLEFTAVYYDGDEHIHGEFVLSFRRRHEHGLLL